MNRQPDMKSMSTILRRTLAALPILLLGGFIAGCEDPVPTDFEPSYVFTGYIYGGEYPTNVRIANTVPPLDSFDYSRGEIDDAVVRIWSDQDTFNLVYVAPDLPGDGAGFYRAADTTQTVKAGTRYSMRAEMSDGTVLTATTEVPEQIEWIRRPPEVIQYPLDTIKLPPSQDTLIWTRVPGVQEYLIEVQALDTLNYGSYLEPATEEENRRIERIFDVGDRNDEDVARWGFLQNTRVTVVWFAFKWFGEHDITIYAPDPALLEWFKQVRFGGNQYNRLLSNIEGGLGVFGSATWRVQRGFLLKNQP